MLGAGPLSGSAQFETAPEYWHVSLAEKVATAEQTPGCSKHATDHAKNYDDATDGYHRPDHDPDDLNDDGWELGHQIRKEQLDDCPEGHDYDNQDAEMP